MEQVAAPGGESVSYRLPLGDSWARIRLDENSSADVEALLDTAFTGIPPEASAAARQTLTARFATQVEVARANAGLDLYVPADRLRPIGPDGHAAPEAVILTAAVTIPTAVPPEPLAVIRNVVQAHPAARTGVIAGAPAVRLNSNAEDSDEGDVSDASDKAKPCRIEYVIVVPDDDQHRWLSIALNVQAVGDGVDDPTDRLVAEFDRAVAELEWR